MKKRLTAQFAFFNLRALIALLISGAAVSSMLSGVVLAFFRPEPPARVSPRTLTFADRVAYQQVIEDVYWRHRIWPKERPDPKPSLDAVMPEAQLETKVADYLRNSQTLEDSYHHAITAQQLQDEMERMAKHTKQPEVLRELFEALGDDPFVIAECLARPVLAERLIHGVNNEGGVKLTRIAWRKQPLQSWVAKAEAQVPVTIAPVSASYTLPVIVNASDSWSPSVACIDDTWTLTSTAGAPDARSNHTAVWTGSEMIVWGGGDSFNTGGRYNPSTDSWTATSTTNAPVGRSNHTAVWTGSEMIVWGGVGNTSFNTGGRYNPTTDSWTATSTTNAPAGRYYHAAVWTGNEMIVWGGWNVISYFNTGGRYNPNTDSWTSTSTVNAPASRVYHTAVWAGSEMIVWGGQSPSLLLNTGGRYNPATDSWIATSTTNAPDGRRWHTAVWTGNRMIVWGGDSYGGFGVNTGGRYDPSSNSWTATSTTNAPAARELHTAVWTGSEMIVWGETSDSTGGRYNPGTNIWIGTSTAGAPAGRQEETAVWTGSEMIVWGGIADGYVVNTGGRYCAGAASPQVVLYDQYNNAGTDATVSATSTDSPSYNSDLADDFVVPGGQTWHVQSIDADGAYFNCPNNNCIGATDWNVFFYTNSAGFPGTQIYSAMHQAAVQSGPMFTVYLPAPAVLGAGTHWVEVQANMTFSTEGEWGWADRTVTSHNAAAWQNPGGGFALCPSWSRRAATCNIDPSEPDQVYRLNGTIGSPTPTPTRTPTAIPTPTATPTPTPTPTPTASPTPTPTPTPCTGRCSPTPRPNPTSAGRPTPPPRITPPPPPTGSPRPTPPPRP